MAPHLRHHKQNNAQSPAVVLERFGLARNQMIWFPGSGGESGGADHDRTFVPGPAGADRAGRRGWQHDPASGPPLCRERLGGHQADAAGAPDRQLRPSEDRGLPASPAGEARGRPAGHRGAPGWDLTLREIKAALGARGIVVKALSTLADMLHRLDLSHKKTACERPSRIGPTWPGTAAAGGWGSATWMVSASSSSTRPPPPQR